MKRSKFSEAPIAFTLRQAEEGTAIGEVCRKAGISEATFYAWRKKYAGLTPSEMKRLRQPRRRWQAEEDCCRSLAGQGYVAGCAEPKALRPVRRRQLVDEVRATWKVSIRHACRALRTDTLTYHYNSRRGDQTGLSKRIQEIAQTAMRYGYRRIHVLLRREGRRVNAKKMYRLYREFGLQLRNKVPKRRVKVKLREDRCPALHANETWAMDFVHDQLVTGRKLRVLGFQ